MAAKATLKPPPAFDELRKKGLQAYWVIRKVLQLMDRISHKGVSGFQAFAAAKSLAEIDKAVADGALAGFEKELRGWVKDTQEQIKAGQEEFKGWFGGELEKKLKESGLKLAGQFPDLHASFFRIKVDLDNGSVKIAYGPDEEPLGKTDAHPDDVAGVVQNVLRGLDGLRLPDESLLEKIYTAYDRCLKMNDLRVGEKVGILEVLKEFVWLIQNKRFSADPRRENFREYSRIAFSYHVSKLEKRDHDGKRLELTVAAREQAAKREEHLWIPTDAQGNGTHFSGLAFK